jgi:hypothetical protein
VYDSAGTANSCEAEKLKHEHPQHRNHEGGAGGHHIHHHGHMPEFPGSS